MAETKKGSNYDIFKMDALKRFLTYEQAPLIRRLNLDADERYIYITFCGRYYRIGRTEPLMEYRNVWQADGSSCDAADAWKEADANAVLTICDLLCHTEEPVLVSGTFTTLEGLNRVKAGSGTILGEGFYGKTERFFNDHVRELAAACEVLGGVPMGKGDVAYRIPLFGSLALQISFYEADDEFPAKLTFFLDKDICKYLFYETLWYMIGFVMDTLKEIIESV
ncbi:MAG: DUF3786 domain-containing protein [Lachnospiraceae bacterium]|nr:DUF3786 domain-containing protein [Lachnospiraceae bacterium]